MARLLKCCRPATFSRSNQAVRGFLGCLFQFIDKFLGPQWVPTIQAPTRYAQKSQTLSGKLGKPGIVQTLSGELAQRARIGKEKTAHIFKIASGKPITELAG